MHPVSLSPATFARLQRHAVPLVDTIESVINRALDALEARDAADGRTAAAEDGARVCDPATPPSLSFTTVKSAVVAGRRLPPSQTYWNSVVEELLREAARRGHGPDEIAATVVGNAAVGAKEGGGYRFVEEAGVSWQGLDANGAWRAAFHLADRLGVAVEIGFVWQETAKAAHPGESGRLVVPG